MKSHPVVHAIALDDYCSIAGWHLKTPDGNAELESPGGNQCWRLAVEDAGAAFDLTETISRRGWRVSPAGEAWQLKEQ